MLDHRDTPPADVLIKGAHVLDPRTGIDERLDVRITNGTIAELGVDLQTDGETVDGTGKHVFPGSVLAELVGVELRLERLGC